MASVMKIPLLAQEALTADKVGSSVALELYQSDFLGYIDISANDASTTVDCDIEHSADGTNWIVAGSFTQVVNTTGQEAISIDKLLPYVRANVDLTGTPAATVEVALYTSKSK